MELQEYIRLFRRWFWLIFLAAFVAGSVGFITRSGQQPTYRAQTTLIIGNFIQDPNPDSGSIRAPLDLAQTYQQLVRTQNILQATVESLNLPMSAGELRGLITTRTIADTSLMVIVVDYSDPVLAADIANELGQQLIDKSPSNLTPEQQAQIDINNEQISTLTDELRSLQDDRAALNEQLAATEDETERARLDERRATIVENILQASDTIARLTQTNSNLQQRINSLEVVEEAMVSTNPIGTSPLNATVLAAMVGAALAMGVVLLIEYLNDTFRTADEVTRTLNLPILGVISRFGKSGDSYSNRLINNEMLFSRTADEYRGLRTNLLFSTQNKGNNVYLVTSPVPQDGKSVTVANLAVSMALADMRVVLIDADLRRPRVHEVFNVPNEVGLTTLLSSRLRDNNLDIASDQSWRQCVHQTEIPNLWVIPSGFIPKNPTEVLGSVVLKHWIEVFQKTLHIDVILFDTAPCLVVSDAVVLAKSADSHVVMVVQANSTRRSSALRAKERFEKVDWEVTGVVLNSANPRDEDYYGYYTYYYQSEGKTTAKQPSR
jgi:polysaccharide biosynthesis transport protein